MLNGIAVAVPNYDHYSSHKVSHRVDIRELITNIEPYIILLPLHENNLLLVTNIYVLTIISISLP